MLKIYDIGDSCICAQLDLPVSKSTSAIIINTFNELKTGLSSDVLDIVPAYNSIAVHYDPFHIDHDVIKTELHKVIHHNINIVKDIKSNIITIPVEYNGMDINEIGIRCKMSVNEIIDVHTSPEYMVAMIGFRAHFPYLLGLPQSISMPRRSSPRVKVPAGSVAIGGTQTGVYPCDGPGGWNIIGNTDPELLKTISIGDTIKFVKM